MDSMRLELLKNKDERAQSAIASQEVKKHLAGFIRSKRLGSSTQINSIAGQNQQALAQSSNGPNDLYQASEMANSNTAQRQLYGAESFGMTGGHGGDPNACPSTSAGIENDDHPLRKTASMPTMHIPYKAQSLSRRRQMERRTTMSPLMKRKSRPRRLVLSSLDSKVAEYSSNPCIMSHASGANNQPVSLSQSSSPPLTNVKQLKHHLQPSTSGNARQLLADSALLRASSQTNLDESNRTRPGAMRSAELMALDASEEDHLKQLRHLRVQEAIRMKVIDRATSRSRMAAAGGSLDSERSLPRYTASLLAAGPDNCGGGEGSVVNLDPAVGFSSGNLPSSGNTSTNPQLVARNRDELRQWSLDAADMRANTASAGMSAVNRTLAWGLLQHLRLATTSDAASLRQSQAPNSSISMGLTSGANFMPQQPQQQQQRLPPPANKTESVLRLSQQQLLLRANRLYSSSSSSASSLLSAQDSFDDSSSQAIDLSSSSEACRQRQQQQQQQQLQQQQQMISNNPALFMMPPTGDQATRLNYHKVLQESFNQLQLCQSRDGMKRMLMPAHSIEVAQLANQPQLQQQQQQSHPLLGHTNRTGALSLDIPNLSRVSVGEHEHQRELFLASLAEQFNLSESAQNLLSIQQQQVQLGNLIAHQQQQHQRQQQQDLNDWLVAYNGLAQSSDLQRSNQINSSLLAKLAALSESHQSALVAQLFQQQQQQHHQMLIQASTLNVPTEGGQLGANLIASHENSTQAHADEQARSVSISRALSSPLLLVPGARKAPMGLNMDVDMQATSEAQERQQMDRVDKEIGLFARSLHQQLNNNQHQQMAIDQEDNQETGEAATTRRLDQLLAGQRQQRPANDDNQLLQSSGGHQFSLDLSLSSASADNTTATTSTTTTTSGIGNKIDPPEALRPAHLVAATAAAAHGSHQARLEGSVGSLQANFASMSCSSGGGGVQHEFSKQLSNCTNLLYNPRFDPNSSTGLVYELELCNHKCICNNENNHPENSYRVLAIWRRLYDAGLMSRCARIAGRKATLAELQLCHSETYANYFGRNPYERIKLRQLDLSKLPIEGLTQLECGGQGADIDTAWNEEKTPAVARLAAGCVIEAAVKVAQGRLLNAFAIVRPPGHHAEYQQAMGFCFFNSVAVAARVLLERHQLSRVLIVDWDVHHGNGIQKMFYEDKRVMYISLHRHDKGNFFPGTGNLNEIGSNEALGFNWNIAWSGETMGDAEYLAAFRSLVMPIAQDFNPSMVLVACGFDAAHGHSFNFGGYKLSPACFAHMTRQLMGLANGRLVLCLEGGYQLTAICDCAESCVRTLLRDNNSNNSQQQAMTNDELGRAPLEQVLECELKRQPNQSAREVLHQLSQLAAEFWPNVQRWRHTIEMSAFDAANTLM